MRIALFTSFAVVLFFCSCNQGDSEIDIPPLPPVERISLLALGDSYTKGQGISFDENFPSQLFDSLANRGNEMIDLEVIAQTGWRTDQLIAAIEGRPDLNGKVFGLVTLCIGVNNQFQNRDTSVYRVEFENLLQQAIAFTDNRPERVLVLSIPDYAFTPFGQMSSNPDNISTEIDAYNAINVEISSRYNVLYVDVTGISRWGIALPNLVDDDRLHPSADQYTLWVEDMLEVIEW